MTDRNDGNPEVDALSHEELVRYFEAHRDDEAIWSKKSVGPRKIRGRRGPSTLFQMRIAPKELEEIARAANGNISDFVRTAALEKARQGQQAGSAATLRKLRAKIRELDELVSP